MKLTFTMFLTKTDNIMEFADDDCMFVRLDSVSEEDAAIICQLGEKYSFNVAAFLHTGKD